MSLPIGEIVPKIKSGINIFSFPIKGPQEAFLLNLVDGFTNIELLASISGCEEADVLAIMQRFAQLGAIELPGEAMRTVRDLPGTIGGNVAKASSGLTSTAVIDLSPKAQQEIDRLLALGPNVSPFVLLDIEPNANIARIKQRYFILAKMYHPDRFYNRELGPYKERLDTLFERINNAYLTLSDPVKLAELQAKEGGNSDDSAAKQGFSFNPGNKSTLSDSNRATTQKFDFNSGERNSVARDPVVRSSQPAAPPVVGTLSSEELEARRRTIINQRRYQQNPFIDREERAEQAMVKGIELLKKGLLLEPCTQFTMAMQLLPNNLFYRSLVTSFAYDERHPAYKELLQIEVLVNSGYLDRASDGYNRLCKDYYKEAAFHFMSGLLYFRQNRPMESMRATQKAVAIAPEQLLNWLLASQLAVVSKDNVSKEYYWKQANTLANKLGCAIMEIGPLMALK